MRSLIKAHILKLNCARSISVSSTLKKIIPDNLKGKSKSSQDWISRQLNDEYVIKSRYHGYRCRSAFKLLEMDEKYKILKPGLSVVECGACPGSWTQVIVSKLKLDKLDDDAPKKGIVIAVDLQMMESVSGAIVMSETDFTNPSVQAEIVKLLPNHKADVILSDMAPSATGQREIDCIAIVQLVYSALKFSLTTLKKDGTFLCKVWDGKEADNFFKGLQNLFSSVKRVKPKASRVDSTELFLLARGYKADEFINKIKFF